MASLLAERVETILWRANRVSEAITGARGNPLFLRGIRLSGWLASSSSLDAVLAGAEAIVMAVPFPIFPERARRSGGDSCFVADAERPQLPRPLRVIHRNRDFGP